MKLVAIAASVLTLIYLSYSFLAAKQVSQSNHSVVKTLKSVTPAYISDSHLLVEQVWLQLKAERIKAKQTVDKKDSKATKDKDVLTIGDDKYALYGIFNSHKEHDSHSGQAFILIKALRQKGKSEESFMLKIKQGEELSSGVTLVAIDTNSISFQLDDELIEFKLFEAKNQQ